MSGLHKQYKTDNELEINGVDITFDDAPNDDGTIPTFKIARMGGSNKAYQKALEAATRPFRRLIELGTMKNEKAEEIQSEVFATTVLKGWKNYRDSNDKEIEFNKVNALALFKELPDVYLRLQEEARIASNFRESSIQEESKN